MKIKQTISINKSADDVWKIVAHDFDQAHRWMGPVPHSYELGNSESKTGAPMEGRMCQLSKDPNGAKAKEVITHYSEAGKTLTFEVTSVNVPAIVPLKKNTVQMTVRSTGINQSDVEWIASPQLKTLAYPFYPLLRLMLPVAFGKLLSGLKTYAEESAPETAAA